MKKVARMRISPTNMNEEISTNQNASTQSQHLNNEPVVRTTGRIKKPKAVFDPSDNYLPRAQRALTTSVSTTLHQNNTGVSFERRSNSTKSSTVSPVAAVESKDACVSCKKKESKRPAFATKNPLISCLKCQRKIHKLCLKVDFEDFDNLQRNFKCDQCSNCKICNDSFNNPEEEMIICSKCTKCFHILCFPTMIIKSDSLRNWKCNKCQVYNQITNGTALPVKKIREIIGSGEPTAYTPPPIKPAIPTEQATSPDMNADNSKNDSTKSEEPENISASPPPEKRIKLDNQSDNVSVETNSQNTPSKSDATNLCYSPSENYGDIPDVKEWSVDQVYEYFFKHFPREAHVFKDEEIDGRSLLLLKRSDVVKKLPIKLGPSLRIYSVILKIQAQINDATLGWNCGL